MTEFKNIVIIDDHVLFAHALRDLIDKSKEYKVAMICGSAIEYTRVHKAFDFIPDLLIVDINMPEMNGIEFIHWARKNDIHTPILSLSMMDDETTIIKAIKAGAAGYLLKDSHPNELLLAIKEVIDKNYFSNEISAKAFRHDARNEQINLSSNEQVLLQHVCSELTYKEIADKMNLSPKTIDGYRENLFRKLNVKTRVGLVMYAIKHKLVRA